MRQDQQPTSNIISKQADTSDITKYCISDKEILCITKRFENILSFSDALYNAVLHDIET